MTTTTRLPLDASEMAYVHQLHAFLKAVGCTARPKVDDLYDRCACGRGKYRWLERCRRCHEKAMRATRTSGVGESLERSGVAGQDSAALTTPTPEVRAERVLTSKLCEGCQQPIAIDAKHVKYDLRQQRFCSRKCANVAIARAERLPPETCHSPVIWDGVTQYSESPPRKRLYELRCWQGGHSQGTAYLTDAQARTARIVGVCMACRGQLFLECLEDGQIGGGLQQHVVGWAARQAAGQ